MTTELLETSEVVSPEGVRCSVSELAPQNDAFLPKLVEGKTTHCFTCERSFVYRGGRFCSATCEEVFDTGTMFAETRASYSYLDGRPMRPKGDGFTIVCPGCARTFVSRGIRFCSPACETNARRKAEIAETIADSGVQVDTKRRPCETCGTLLPRWRKGKQLNSRVRFCSARCKSASKRGELGHPSRNAKNVETR